jgi:hypothetical protein
MTRRRTGAYFPPSLRTLRSLADRLEARVHEAWELRNSAYSRDAVDAVLEEWDRRRLNEYELRQQELADLRRLLRKSDPHQLARRDAT